MSERQVAYAVDLSGRDIGRRVSFMHAGDLVEGRLTYFSVDGHRDDVERVLLSVGDGVDPRGDNGFFLRGDQQVWFESPPVNVPVFMEPPS